jgi:RNA polymerase sigma factor (sigma-70 family)
MTITALSDAELLEQARAGDEAAFTELYVRHEAAARRLASTYRRVGDPDDLVSGAFERVLGAIRRGEGPTESFRAYLFVTLRRLAAEQGERPADQPLEEVPGPVGDAADTPEMGQADREMITQAFESLPERWQAVLWHTAVEGRQPKELAGVLGVSANAAAAMAYRAREKLRQSYLQAHLLASPAPEHEPYRSQLGAYVRDGLSKRDHAAVEHHLEGCESCRALVAELEDANRMLARAVLPLFLLAGAKVGGGAVVAVAAAGGAAAGGAGGQSGILGKLRHAAGTFGSAAAITAVVAGLAGLGTVVAREDGSVDQAADAADIGSSSRASDRDDDRGDDDRGDDGDDGGDSLFGDDDFGLSPFDDESSLFGRFGGDDFDPPRSRFVPRSRSGSGLTTRSTRPSTSTPSAPPTSAQPQTSGPGPGPTSPPPDPGPGPTPPPPPLSFASTGWSPSAVGRGQLSLVIAEPAVPERLTSTAFSTPASGTEFLAPVLPAAPAQAAAPLSLRVELTSGARVFPEATVDGRCTPGQTITCTLDQPPTGGSTQFAFDLQIDGPGQTASVKLFRGGVLEAELPAAIELSQFEAGLDLTEPVWTPVTVDGKPLPVGMLTVGATNGGTATIEGATIRLTAAHDAAFLSPALVADALPEGMLDRLPLPPGLRQQLRDKLLNPLPAGCAIEGWTPPPPGTPWDEILRGGLPTTIVCQLGGFGPGAVLSFADIVAVGHPLYGEGDPDTDDSPVTVTLELQGSTIATRMVQLTPPREPRD